MKNFLLLLLVILSANAFAQDHGRFWFFGENAGLDFSTEPPTPITGSLDTDESCSTISDEIGNLLFYTDGTTVWNRNHMIMSNGTGLLGNSSAAQQLIIKNRSTTNLYYIITADVGSQGINYSVVDMNLDSGLGAVLSNQKNISIGGRINKHEKVAAYINQATGIGWLAIFENNTYQLFSFNDGFDLQNPVVSNITLSLTDGRGMLKFSPDGTKLVNTSVGDGAVLTDFDAVTGVVSNPVELIASSTTAADSFYGAEFSPDSQLLYLDANSVSGGNFCNSGLTKTLLQYNIIGGANWNSNPTILFTSSNETIRGSLQLAPNGKIYYSRACSQYLGVINNPTVIGFGANYVHDGQLLAAGTVAREGLPNISISNYINSFQNIKGNVFYDSDQNGCTTSDLLFDRMNILLSETATGNVSTVVTDGAGFYTVNTGNGDFLLTPQMENPSYWTITPASATVNFPTMAGPVVQDFCVEANGVADDLEIVILPLNTAIPGQEVNYKIQVTNKGNQTTSGDVALYFQDNIMDFLRAALQFDSSSNGVISWTLNDLAPFESQTVSITFLLNSGTDITFPINVGDVIGIDADVTVLNGTDADLSDNSSGLVQVIEAATVTSSISNLQGPTIEVNEVGDFMYYQVSFENTTGTIVNNIVVKNNIDLAALDLQTIVPLNSSHSFRTRIRNVNEVEFIFDDINLAPFNDNSGYLLYKIRTQPTLQQGDTFTNNAQVYFDFNAPIITNDFITTVDATASIGSVEDISIKAFPNPTNGFLKLSASSGIENVSVMDVQGRVLSTTDFISSDLTQQLDLSQQGSGIYFLKITTEKGIAVEKVVVE